MENLEINTLPEVARTFDEYPKTALDKLLVLRQLIIEVAQSTEGITKLEETLKWGEPSYVTQHGSTIRIDWKSKSPDQYAMYFKCTSRLVETFRDVFYDTFTFEGKRAIVFQMDDNIPKEALKSCIKAALTYHKMKHLPTLGITE